MVKILTVDDISDVTFSIKKSLESLHDDYEITAVSSGKEAIDMALKLQPDLILLDIIMPDMSGWEIHKSLKNNESTKNIPVIFLTGKTDELSKQMGEQIAADYIMKPFDPKDLDKKIRSALGLK